MWFIEIYIVHILYKWLIISFYTAFRIELLSCPPTLPTTLLWHLFTLRTHSGFGIKSQVNVPAPDVGENHYYHRDIQVLTLKMSPGADTQFIKLANNRSVILTLSNDNIIILEIMSRYVCGLILWKALYQSNGSLTNSVWTVNIHDEVTKCCCP